MVRVELNSVVCEDVEVIIYFLVGRGRRMVWAGTYFVLCSLARLTYQLLTLPHREFLGQLGW